MPARHFTHDVFLSHNRAQKDWTRNWPYAFAQAEKISVKPALSKHPICAHLRPGRLLKNSSHTGFSS
jgi:hypothetical protein